MLAYCFFLNFKVAASFQTVGALDVPPISRAGHVERYQLQSYRFKPFFVTL
jgi:hypothetical protein